MNHRRADIVVVGSGAGGGTVAQALAPMVREGLSVLVLEQGPRLGPEDFTGRELDMASSLYQDGGGFLTADGAMTLAFARAYGGSTVVYTGTSLIPSERVISGWNVPGLVHAEVARRARRYMAENNVHRLPPEELNDNNRLFAAGAAAAGFRAEQFGINVKDCRGSSLCNLGCASGAKQGTDRVQLPRAERDGVEVVTRATVSRMDERRLYVQVAEKPEGGKGAPSEWPAGEYVVHAGMVVLAGGAIGSPALMLRSGLPTRLPRLGEGFTCHPAQILVAEHPHEITNDVGHPKSYFVDRAAEQRYLLETCLYFPATTAKSLVGFGADHSAFLRAYRRLQMILVLACDRAAAGNRVSVDRAGRPVVHYRCTAEVVAALVRGARAAARIFFGAGARRVHVPLADPPVLEAWAREDLETRIAERHFKAGKVPVSAAHLMGGCGMGRTAADSVTDGHGRVHGLPWLYVADASLFPDALEINPYVTIMALADRVADAVREDAPALLAATPRAAARTRGIA